MVRLLSLAFAGNHTTIAEFGNRSKKGSRLAAFLPPPKSVQKGYGSMSHTPFAQAILGGRKAA
jgi:hypothetical protein